MRQKWNIIKVYEGKNGMQERKDYMVKKKMVGIMILVIPVDRKLLLGKTVIEKSRVLVRQLKNT